MRIEKKDKIEKIRSRHDLRMDGGAGSGNWGHSGRPGEIGGSGGGGGSEFRWKDKDGNYTSFSKYRASASVPHDVTKKELESAPKGTKLILGSDNSSVITKIGKDEWEATTPWGTFSYKSEEVLDFDDINKSSLAIPKSADQAALAKELGMETGKSATYAEDNGKGFADNYSSERIGNARIFTDDMESYNANVDQTAEIWKSLDQKDRDSINNYTGGGYGKVNEVLRGADDGYASTIDKINSITETISKSEIQEDTILYRGTGTHGFMAMLGIDDKLTVDNVSSVIGMTGVEKGFMSTGTSLGSGFDDKKVQIELFTPKGTKGIYAEPFSNFGQGQKGYWDGDYRQKSVGYENETILQRGTRVKITDAYYDGAQFRIKACVIGQENVEPIPLF